MKHQEILNLLNQASDSKFITRKWNIASDQWIADYDVGNEIIFNTKVLKSNLSDYSNAYILVEGDIITTAHSIPTQVAFKNYHKIDEQQ